MPTDPEDMPTIREILSSHGAGDYMEPDDFDQMLTELEYRDNVMRTDAVNYAIRKGYDKIITEV